MATVHSGTADDFVADDFVNDVREGLIDRLSPDLWKLSWPPMQQPRRREIMIGLMEGATA